MKKYCTFPDQTTFELHNTMSILDVTESQTCVAYIDPNDEQAGAQVLWVPSEFITTKE